MGKAQAPGKSLGESGPVLLVFGTRPEAIKMAPVIQALKRKSIPYRVCSTGQHSSLLDGVLELFDCKADFSLDIMKPNQSLSDITSSILQKMGEVFRETTPSLVLVHGDTTTSFSTALAAFYAKVPVGHVEAGLRSYDRQNPWPEETNRCLTSILSTLHFAPTTRAQQNLQKENVPGARIYVTGNTIIDALQYVDLSSAGHEERIRANFPFLDSRKKLILSTFHRRENHGEGIRQICEAILEISKTHEVQFVIPVHPNPNVFEEAQKILGRVQHVHLAAPLDYRSFVYLMKRCYLILTDSGGIQEEAPAFGKPVLVMRETTERPEAMEAGLARLVGSSKARIVSEVNRLLIDPIAYQAMTQITNPFGDGKAAQHIAEIISSAYFTSGNAPCPTP